MDHGNDLAFVFIHDHERHLLLLRHGPLRMKYSDHSGDLNNEDETTEWLISCSLIRQSTSLGDSVHEITLVSLFDVERFCPIGSDILYHITTENTRVMVPPAQYSLISRDLCFPIRFAPFIKSTTVIECQFIAATHRLITVLSSLSSSVHPQERSGDH